MPKKPGPKTELLDGPLERATYMVDTLTRRRLKVLGDGNESLGLRNAARVAYDRYQAKTGTTTGTTTAPPDAPKKP